MLLVKRRTTILGIDAPHHIIHTQEVFYLRVIEDPNFRTGISFPHTEDTHSIKKQQYPPPPSPLSTAPPSSNSCLHFTSLLESHRPYQSLLLLLQLNFAAILIVFESA